MLVSEYDRAGDAFSLKVLQSPRYRRNPYEYYAALHERGAAAELNPAVDGYDVIVYGYEAVDRVLKDHTRFKLMDAPYMDATVPHWRDHVVLRALKDSMFFVNDEVHLRMRHLFSSVFTPRRTIGLEPAIARMTVALLDRMEELGAGGAPVDFMAEFAFPLPSNVIGELLGVPEADRAWFRPRVRTIGELFELDGSTWSNMRAADQAATELLEYFAGLTARRRVDPDTDLVSGLVAADADRAALSETELLANLLALFNAGFVTTTHLFGCGLTLLLERPDALAAVRDDPDAVGAHVEEILRFAPSTHFLIRYAAADADVAGVPVRKGQSVVVAIAAANRDPRRFPDPDTFDPHRSDNKPLTFGAGPHFCLGAALTRAEGRVAFPLLLNRFPKLAVAGDPGPPTRLQFRGYETLEVTLD